MRAVAARSRGMTRRSLLRNAAALTGGSLLAGSEWPRHLIDPADAAAAKQIVVAMDSWPLLLDPHQAREVSSRRLTKPLFDALLQYAADGFTIQPALAERWENSANGLAYTFYLRRGVQFHDGTPCNAQAVKFSFERQLNPDPKMGAFPFGKARWSELTDIQVVNDYTVRFHLSRPKAGMADYATDFSANIVSPAAAQKYGKDFPFHPVGTGMYKFVSWDQGKQVIFEANPDYWGGAPQVGRVIVVAIPEPQPRITALQTGTADWIYLVPPDNLAGLRRDSTVMLQRIETPNNWYVMFNFARTPFDNVLVRRALNYAVDKTSIVQDILKGTGVVAQGPMGEAYGVWRDPSVAGYSYDPAKAKSLLAQAGVAAGFNTTMVVPQSGAGMQQPVPMATVIQSNLKAVGVGVEIQTVDFGAANAAWDKGNFALSPRAFNPAIGDPDNLFGVAFHSHNGGDGTTNYGGYTNPHLDALIAQGRGTVDMKARVGVYRQIQQLVVEDAPWIFVDHEILYNAARHGVTGVRLHPNGDLRLDGAAVTS